MTWWAVLAVPVLWIVFGEVWSRLGSGRDRVLYVPLPVDAINALPGLTLVRRGRLEGPAWKTQMIRDHEHRHTLQRRATEGDNGRRVGWCRWWWRYLLSVEWRCRYEADAYARNIIWRETRSEGARDRLVEAYAGHVLGRYWTGLPPWGEVPSEAEVETMIRESLP